MVELIPKKTKKIEMPIPGNIFFYFSIAIFTGVSIAFVILIFLLSSSQVELDKVEQKINELRSPESVALQEELLSIQDKTTIFARLLKQHYDLTKFFSALEKLTHPEVQFTSISLDNNEGAVELSALAKNLVAAEQQFRILDQDSLFGKKTVEFSGFSIKEEGVGFSLKFSFDPKELYKYNSNQEQDKEQTQQ